MLIAWIAAWRTVSSLCESACRAAWRASGPSMRQAVQTADSAAVGDESGLERIGAMDSIAAGPRAASDSIARCRHAGRESPTSRTRLAGEEDSQATILPRGSLTLCEPVLRMR